MLSGPAGTPRPTSPGRPTPYVMRLRCAEHTMGDECARALPANSRVVGTLRLKAHTAPAKALVEKEGVGDCRWVVGYRRIAVGSLRIKGLRYPRAIPASLGRASLTECAVWKPPHTLKWIPEKSSEFTANQSKMALQATPGELLPEKSRCPCWCSLEDLPMCKSTGFSCRRRLYTSGYRKRTT